MGIFDKSNLIEIDHTNGKKEIIKILTKESYDSFDESILGLGDITVESIPINALVGIFDLEGFTNFCSHFDPQLVLPEFLSMFLKWIFKQLRLENIDKTYKLGYSVYAELPFYCKFMGDGLMFIWKTDHLRQGQICDIVVTAHEICNKYINEFIKTISDSITNPPPKLRCGLARGIIYSVGNGNDFVGPCINVASRLQKISSLTFCFLKQGIDIRQNDYLNKITVVKNYNIRGISSSELICIIKEEFELLSKEEKKLFVATN